MTEFLDRRAFLCAGASVAALTVLAAAPVEAQSHDSGGSASKGKGQGGKSGGDKGHDSETDHGDDHGDDHADDHGDNDDHDDDHGSDRDHGNKGKGKGPRYRGGRGETVARDSHGHSLEDRVLKWPIND